MRDTEFGAVMSQVLDHAHLQLHAYCEPTSAKAGKSRIRAPPKRTSKKLKAAVIKPPFNDFMTAYEMEYKNPGMIHAVRQCLPYGHPDGLYLSEFQKWVEMTGKYPPDEGDFTTHAAKLHFTAWLLESPAGKGWISKPPDRTRDKNLKDGAFVTKLQQYRELKLPLPTITNS